MKAASFILLLLALAGMAPAEDKFLTDEETNKTIVLLDNMPNDWQFEFWIGPDAPVLVKQELLIAINDWLAVRRDRRIQAKKSCKVSRSGDILNFPCRISTKQAKK